MKTKLFGEDERGGWKKMRLTFNFNVFPDTQLVFDLVMSWIARQCRLDLNRDEWPRIAHFINPALFVRHCRDMTIINDALWLASELDLHALLRRIEGYKPIFREREDPKEFSRLVDFQITCNSIGARKLLERDGFTQKFREEVCVQHGIPRIIIDEDEDWEERIFVDIYKSNK